MIDSVLDVVRRKLNLVTACKVSKKQLETTFPKNNEIDTIIQDNAKRKNKKTTHQHRGKGARQGKSKRQTKKHDNKTRQKKGTQDSRQKEKQKRVESRR